MMVYLAGKMSGLPYFNAAAFDYAAHRLRSLGFMVFSPVENDRERYGREIHENNPTGDIHLALLNHSFSKNDALREDLSWICDNADAIALLPGWEGSKGAQAELTLAHALGLTVIVLGKEFVE